MRKLFAVLFSLHLILAPMAFAQSGGSSGGGTPDLREVKGEDYKQNGGLTDAYLKTGTGSKGGYDFYVKQIMTLGTGAIGASIVTQCLEGLKTPSIAAFMAGSLTQMMSEILGGKAKTERNTKKMADLKIVTENLAKSGDSSQLEALKAALQEEKDTRDFLKKRKGWQIAISVIYAAAAGLAIAEEIYGNAAGMALAQTACAGYGASCTLGAAACEGMCQAGLFAGIAKMKATMTLPQARETTTAFCASLTAAGVGCTAHANTYLNLVYGSCQMIPTDGGASQLSWGTLLGMAYGFGNSAAASKSGSGGIAQYGSMVITLIPLVTKSFSKLVVSMYNFPIPRSITFGAATAFSGVVAAGLGQREKTASENVDKLEKVVNQFKLTSEGTTGIPQDGGGDDNGPGKKPGKDPLKTADIKKLPTGVKPVQCFSQGSKGIEHSSSGCSNPVRLSKLNFGKINLPAINNVSNMAQEMTNALARGDEASAANLAGQIGSYAARVKAETEKLKEQYNALQKKDQKEPVNFDKSIQAQVAALEADLSKAASQNNIDLAAAGAAISQDKEPIKDESVPEVTTASVPAVNVPAADPLAGFGTEEGTVETADTGSGKAEQSLDDFESSEQDISKKPEVSIFKQLSNRYILNYTKMFDEKKKPAVVEETPKN